MEVYLMRLRNAIETIEDLEVRVVNIPAFIALKLLAWGDRGERTSKDLEEIDLILKNYRDDERVYAELVDEIAEEIIEFLDASIYLLGRDIRQIFRLFRTYYAKLSVKITAKPAIPEFYASYPNSTRTIPKSLTM